MTEDQKARIEEITGRVEKATDAPWVQWVGHNKVFAGPVSENTRVGIRKWSQPICETDDDYPGCGLNAEFIAHSRQDVPFLLQLVQELDELSLNLSSHSERVATEATALKLQRDEYARALIGAVEAATSVGWVIGESLQPLLARAELIGLAGGD